VFVAAILLVACAQALLGFDHLHLWRVVAALTLFFAVFNYLEARLPALVTQAAPGSDRGAALGVFATCQFLGAFVGGTAGGVMLGRFGLSGVFWGSATVAAGWAVVAFLGSRGRSFRRERA
jgi:predicted MFS family arabinose efflux permease